MFASIGHWLSSVYVILCLHAVPVWLVSSHIRLGLKVTTTPYLAWLVACLWGLAPGPGVLGAGESSPAMASLDPSTMS